MEITLTESQVDLALWLVEQHKAGLLPEEFTVAWELRNYKPEKGKIVGMKGEHPEITYAALAALENAGLILTIHKEIMPARKSGTQKIRGSEVFQYGLPRHEKSRTYTLLGNILRYAKVSKGSEVSSLHHNQVKVDRPFVSLDLIEQLESIEGDAFDIARLVKYCHEINDNFQRGNYHSVIFLARAILDHCPPVFGQPHFDAVVAHYKGRSFKDVAKRLNSSLKKIADYHIHKQIGRKEVLPVEEELDFSPDLNFLLARIIENLHYAASPKQL